jgi:hypothetical protein
MLVEVTGDAIVDFGVFSLRPLVTSRTYTAFSPDSSET